MLSHYKEGAYLGKAQKLSVFPQDPTCSDAACLKALVPLATSSVAVVSALKEQPSQATALHVSCTCSCIQVYWKKAYLVKQETSKVPHLQLGTVFPILSVLINQLIILSCSPD